MPVDTHQHAHAEAHRIIRNPVHIGVPGYGVRDPQLPKVEAQDPQQGKGTERVSQAQCYEASKPSGLLVFDYI